jgi:transcription antitermination protein NusB
MHFMSLPRRKFREIVFQLLYSNHYSKIDEEASIPFMMDLSKTTKKNVKEAHSKVLEIEKNILAIDSFIENTCIDYKLARISRIELNVLRLGLYELMFDSALPPNVAIAEALRLCRKFGSSESAKFVNAILDCYSKNHVRS